MKKLLTSLIAASLFLPITTLASSTRPGSRVTHQSLNSSARTRGPSCLVLEDDGEFVEEKWKKCEVVIDETGVDHPIGKITKVVQWKTAEKNFSYGGALVGGAAGASAGFAAGLGSCMVIGPLCLITAPAMMGAGLGGGAELGGKGTGRFFTVVGDDINGRRLIQEFRYGSGRTVREAQKQLLNTTGLAEGETRT